MGAATLKPHWWLGKLQAWMRLHFRNPLADMWLPFAALNTGLPRISARISIAQSMSLSPSTLDWMASITGHISPTGHYCSEHPTRGSHQIKAKNPGLQDPGDVSIVRSSDPAVPVQSQVPKSPNPIDELQQLRIAVCKKRQRSGHPTLPQLRILTRSFRATGAHGFSTTA